MPLNELYAIAMLASFFVLLMLGIPVGIGLAVAGFVWGWLGFGPLLFNLLPHRIFGVVTNYTLLAIPLFVFLGVMLEKSRLAKRKICWTWWGAFWAPSLEGSASASSLSAC